MSSLEEEEDGERLVEERDLEAEEDLEAEGDLEAERDLEAKRGAVAEWGVEVSETSANIGILLAAAFGRTAMAIQRNNWSCAAEDQLPSRPWGSITLLLGVRWHAVIWVA